MQNNQPEDLLSRLIRLERRLDAVERRAGLSNAMSRGTFRVATADGTQTKVYFGPLAGGGVGWLFYRDNGNLAFSLEGANPANQFVAIRDEALNVVVSDDAASGQGLATPWLAYSSTTWAELTSPSQLTTSATFQQLHRIHGLKQHPKVEVWVLCLSDAGTTGEVRLNQGGGANIIGPSTIPAADNSYHIMDGAVNGTFGSSLFLDVEARRTGGTGNIRVAVVLVLGRQS